MSRYEFVGTREREYDVFCIDGVDITSSKWRSTGNCVTVVDPKTGKTYSFTEYYIERLLGDNLFFAQGYFGNGKEAFFEKT